MNNCTLEQHPDQGIHSQGEPNLATIILYHISTHKIYVWLA